MNKLFFSLLLCGVTAITINTYSEQGQRPEVIYYYFLNNGNTVGQTTYDHYNPILEQLCSPDPNANPLCAKLLALAEWPGTRLDPEAIVKLRKLGLIDSCGDIRGYEGGRQLIRASLKEKEPNGISETVSAWLYGKKLEYCNPLKPSTK